MEFSSIFFSHLSRCITCGSRLDKGALTPKSFAKIVRTNLNLSFYKINSCLRTNLCQNRRMSFVSVSVDKINVFFSLSPLTSQEIYYQNNSPQSAWARLRWKSRLDGLSFIGFPHGIKHPIF